MPDPTPTAAKPSDLEQKEVNDWIQIGLRLAVSSALHPLDYSKTLIQLGYEPVPAKTGRTLMGKQVELYPNVFSYIGYIRQNDGFFGMYRGLAPKLAGSFVSMVLSEKIADSLGVPLPQELGDIDLNDEQLLSQFKENLKRDLVVEVSGVILSHPLHVISVRMMAQFVGKETLYDSFIGSIVEIYKDNGVLGFFSGITPKLLFDVLCLVLSSSTVYVLNKYLIKDKVARQYNTSITQFVFSSVLYPLQLISTCMTVTGSKLAAGNPPNMTVYNNWRECWDDLHSRDELKRGSSLFFRAAPSQKAKRVRFALAKFK